MGALWLSTRAVESQGPGLESVLCQLLVTLVKVLNPCESQFLHVEIGMIIVHTP